MEATNIKFTFEAREPDSPFVEMIWRTQSESAGTFTSAAVSHWEMVIARHKGETTLTVRGPETIASLAPCPDDAEFFGIVFKHGVFMPHLPVCHLVNHAINLPVATNHSFWLYSALWEIPTYDNADVFIDKLLRQRLLVHEPVVDAVLQNRPLGMSLRTVQRRFLRATGLTHGTLEQIERARQAATLLAQGTSIADAIYQAGYADQPHLTRSLKRFMGQTPGQILCTNRVE